MKSIKRILVMCILAIFTISITGCSKNNVAANKKSIEIIDVLGRKVVLEKPATRLAVQWSGSGGGLMTLAALDKEHFQDKIVALDDSLPQYRLDMWNQFCKDVPELKNIPRIGTIDKNEFSVEKLIELKPEVFFLPVGLKEYFTSTMENQLKGAGIAVIFIDYHDQTVKGHIKSTEIIGKTIGKEKEAKDLNDFYVKQMKIVEERLKDLNDNDKPSVYLECGMYGPSKYGNTYSKNYMWGQVVENAGGNNIMKDVVKKSQPANPEYILDKDPEFIIMTGSYWRDQPESMFLGYECDKDKAEKSLAQFTKRPGWKNLKAVKNKNFYAIHHAIGREMYDFYAVQKLAKILHPEKFKDVDPDSAFKEYFEKFMPFKMKGVWYTKLN